MSTHVMERIGKTFRCPVYVRPPSARTMVHMLTANRPVPDAFDDEYLVRWFPYYKKYESLAETREKMARIYGFIVLKYEDIVLPRFEGLRRGRGMGLIMLAMRSEPVKEVWRTLIRVYLLVAMHNL